MSDDIFTIKNVPPGVEVEPSPLVIIARDGRELVRFSGDGTILIEGEPVDGLSPSMTVKQLRDWCDAVDAHYRARTGQALS